MVHTDHLFQVFNHLNLHHRPNLVMTLIIIPIPILPLILLINPLNLNFLFISLLF